jgi:site-specific recombinase XerD
MLSYLERQDLTTLLEAAKRLSAKAEAITATLAYTGIRVSELTGLRQKHVLVSGQIAPAFYLTKAITKTRKERQVTICQELSFVLQRYFFKHPPSPDPEAYLFPGQGSNRLTSRAVRYTIHSLGIHALQREISPHTLRHTFGTLLARTAPIRVVQEALGHASLHSTQIYTHVTNRDVHSAVMDLFPGKDQAHEN